MGITNLRLWAVSASDDRINLVDVQEKSRLIAVESEMEAKYGRGNYLQQIHSPLNYQFNNTH